jgi:hypothetical protein
MIKSNLENAKPENEKDIAQEGGYGSECRDGPDLLLVIYKMK